MELNGDLANPNTWMDAVAVIEPTQVIWNINIDIKQHWVDSSETEPWTPASSPKTTGAAETVLFDRQPRNSSDPVPCRNEEQGNMDHMFQVMQQSAWCKHKPHFILLCIVVKYIL